MPELIAKTYLKHPRELAPGERFTVSDKAARVLKMIGKAEDAPTEQRSDGGELPLQQESKRKGGRYSRRDLRAQD